MAAFHLAWPPSRVPGSLEIAGVKVVTEHIPLGWQNAGCWPGWKSSIPIRLLAKVNRKAGDTAAQPGGFSSTQVMRIDYKRELTVWDWTGGCGEETREVR